MANTQAICSSFKQELLKGTHALGTHSIKAALYFATATINASSTVYTTTGEGSGTNYTAGGTACTTGAPGLTSTTAFWQPGANISWSNLTMAAFDAVLLYNDTATNNEAIAVWTFGSTTVTAGTFTINLPAFDSTNALIRLT